MSQKFIDVRSRLPVEEHLGRFARGEKPADSTLWSEDSSYPDLYSHLYEKGEDLLMPIDEYVEKLDDLGIEHKVVPGAEDVYDKLMEFPGKFIPEASVDVVNGRIDEEISDLEDKIKNKEYGAVQLNPYLDGIPANDARYYPVYRKAEELDAPVWLHTSSNFTKTQDIQLGHPSNLHEVCRDFPTLAVIAGHGTWPWLGEGCAMMWKHRNLYTDFSAMRGKYVANNADWAPLMDYGTTVLSDSVLFGTSFPLVDDATQVDDVLSMGLSEDVQQRWCWDNAAEIYDI
jgi:predicted TIM-barrel fold metal-dependent hydrolase